MSVIIFGHNFFHQGDLKIVYEEDSVEHTPYLKTTRLVVRGYFNNNPVFTRHLPGKDLDISAKEIIYELAKMHHCGIGSVTGEAGAAYRNFIESASRLFEISFSYSGTDEDDREHVFFNKVNNAYNEESDVIIEREIHASVARYYKQKAMRQIKLIKKTTYKYSDALQKKSLYQEVIVEIDADIDLGDDKLIVGLFHEYLN